MLSEAPSRGYQMLSYGRDPFAYGESMLVGLIRHKAEMGFVPSYEIDDSATGKKAQRVYRFLNPGALAQPAVFFSLREDLSVQANLVGIESSDAEGKGPHEHLLKALEWTGVPLVPFPS